MKVVAADLPAWPDEPDTRGKFLPFPVPSRQRWNCRACVCVGGPARFPERSRCRGGICHPQRDRGAFPERLPGKRRIFMHVRDSTTQRANRQASSSWQRRHLSHHASKTEATNLHCYFSRPDHV